MNAPRDRDDGAAIACLLRPTARTFGRLIEALEDRFEDEKE
jgi:hypothetical protein